MDLPTVEVDSKQYQIGRLDAIKQFHVARRILPMFASVAKLSDLMPAVKDAKDGDFAAIIGPVSEALANMKDSEVEYVIFTCMSVVKRENAGQWLPVLPRGGNTLMYDDIQLPQLLQLTVQVVKENLAGFLALIPQEESTASVGKTKAKR